MELHGTHLLPISVVMKIEILIDILDDLEPDALYSITEVPDSQATFDQFCTCTRLETGTEPAEKASTWEDVVAKYPEYEAKWAMKEMREQRDEKLKETDILVLPDRSPSEELLAYRQALRDLPATETPSYNTSDELVVNWPTKP